MLVSNSLRYWKLAGFSLCCLYFFSVILHPLEWHLIDGMNLVVHEAGHVVFRPFGMLMMFMGGSLFQVMVPCFFAGYFWLQRQYLSFAIILLWIGQSLINVSVYIGDAINMRLPLLGGDVTMHDWNNALQMLHSLSAAPALSRMVYILGFLVMLSGVVLGVLSSRKPNLTK